MKFILQKENLQQARSILKKLDITEDDVRFKDLKEYYEERLGNNWGYFGFLTNLIFKQGEHLSSVKKLIDFIVDDKDIIKSLPKNIIKYTSIEKISDDITIQLEWRKYRQEFVNELSGKIKTLAKKDEDLKNEYINSDENTKKDILQNFIPKIARYTDYRKFKSDLKSFLNKTDDIETIIKDIKNQEHAYLVYNENNVVIAEIYKYEASCKLGSKAWCISTEKFHWNDYVSGMNKQYFIWNLNVPKSSNESQVGVTIKEDGTVRTAHYKNDKRASIELYLTKYNIPTEVLTPIDINKDFSKLEKADRLDEGVFTNLIKSDNKELIKKYYDIIPNRLKIKYNLYNEEELSKMNLSDTTKEVLSSDNSKIKRIVNYLSLEEILNSEERKFVDKMTFVDKIYFLKKAMTLNLDYGSDFHESNITEKLFPNTDVYTIDFDEELIYVKREEKDQFFDEFLGMYTETYHHLNSITTHSSMYNDTEEINYCYNALTSDQGLEFMEVLEFLEKNSYHEKLKEYFTKFIKTYTDNNGIEYYDVESFFLKVGLKEVFEVLELCSSAIEEGADQYISEDMQLFSDLENKFDFDSFNIGIGIPIDLIIDSFDDKELKDEGFDYDNWVNNTPLSNQVPAFNSEEGTYEYYSMAQVSEEYKEKIDNQLEKLTSDLEFELAEFLEMNNEKAHNALIDNGYVGDTESGWQYKEFFFYRKTKGDIVSIIPIESIIENGNAVMYIMETKVFKEELRILKNTNIVTDGSEEKPNRWGSSEKELNSKNINVKQINIFDRFGERTKDPNQLSLFEEKLIINFKKFKQRKSI